MTCDVQHVWCGCSTRCSFFSLDCLPLLEVLRGQAPRPAPLPLELILRWPEASPSGTSCFHLTRLLREAEAPVLCVLHPGFSVHLFLNGKPNSCD